MHELSVMKRILDIVVQQAETHKVRKIRAIHLEVGMLSDLEAQWMQHYFDYLSEDTIARKAMLCITWIPVVFQCQECSHTFGAEQKRLADLACPYCGHKGLALVSGRGYCIRNMEVE